MFHHCCILLICQNIIDYLLAISITSCEFMNVSIFEESVCDSQLIFYNKFYQFLSILMAFSPSVPNTKCIGLLRTLEFISPVTQRKSFLKSITFWDMTPCSPLSFNRRFGGTYRLHLQGLRNNFSKNQQGSRWEACSSETSVETRRTTRRHIPEDDTLHNHRCENLKSYKVIRGP
jgi:hypothetical protein